LLSPARASAREALLTVGTLRPEEVCGLRWRDVDLAASTITIRTARTLVDGKPVEKAPKTVAGERVLPLDCTLVARLRGQRQNSGDLRLGMFCGELFPR